ncbi:AraC family transcriptional regulator [Escherichia coli]|uniref:AraC family transcriptional regulator n=1 Tax=Escherichia coli TaxID=562 RepID=UPI000DE9810E|nr:helix-turn-helix domain-containing protein [Escherichia coli]RBQ41313.1 AraC family transcriptional regulator [Escherichia coli]
MNSQRSLNCFNSFKNIVCSNILVLKNIRFYNCAIIYIHSAQLSIKTKRGMIINVLPESICYIEKNTVVDVSLKVLGKEIPYEIYYINSDVLSYVHKAMEPLLLNPQEVSHIRPKIFSCQMSKTDAKIFEHLMSGNDKQHRQIYRIAYLLSKMSNIESLVYSLSVSTDTTFTEKLKMIIESDLSKPWRLLDFSKILNMSEVSIRKKLEKEKNSFNKIVLDIKMHHAAKLITTTEKHVNIIANEVGYISVSYFIRNFKNYYGITPKQFALNIKMN